MTAPRWILAIDHGTTGTTALLVDVNATGERRIGGRGYAEFAQHFPRPGWVEHDLEEIWHSVRSACQRALDHFEQQQKLRRGEGGRHLAAVALANQRETTAIWHRRRGALGRAIVWQDRRTAAHCQRLQEAGHTELLRARTGLVLDPYFSGSKVAWMRANLPAVAARRRDEALCVGTMDTWLLYKLTAGAQHRTDTTNAARTALFDVVHERWDPELCALWDDVPTHWLPEVLPSDSTFGHTAGVDVLPDNVPIIGIAGDQHAAMLGQGCLEPGMAKCTLGTGGFVLLNTGDTLRRSEHGLLGTVAFRSRAERAYALEGSLFVAGAIVQWLRDGLGLIRTAAEVEALAASVPDTGGVTLVPALTGLGAPYWQPEARGALTGLTRGTTAAHVARAALEGIAWQSADLLAAMAADLGESIGGLRMDGGAAQNGLLLQLHADFLQAKVEQARMVETTALGAAYLAGLGLGVFADMAAVGAAFVRGRAFVPSLPADEAARGLAAWRAAVGRTFR